MNRGKLYKLCEDYIRYSNIKYELYKYDNITQKMDSKIKATEDEIRKLVNLE